MRLTQPALPALCLLLALQAPLTAETEAFEEDGVRFETLGETTFVWKSLLRVYDITFSHAASVGAPPPVLDGSQPMRLELRYHRGFSAEDIINGGDALLKRNVDGPTLASLAPRIAQLNRAYVDVKAGDAYTLTHVPGRGTALRLNGRVLARIPGDDFAPAYFRIWLGQSPMCPKVRDALLRR